jgi:hypothetical protein
MKKPGHHRRITVALLISTGLHLLGLWLVHLLIPPEVGERLFRVRVPSYLPRLPERFKPRPAVPVSRELLERLRAEGRPRDLEAEPGEGIEGLLPEVEVPLLEEGVAPLAGEKQEWQAVEDTVPEASLYPPEQVTQLPWASDLVELDALGRKQTLAIVDPETRKLKSAWLHLPCWMNKPLIYYGGRELWEALNLIRRGWKVPGRVPIDGQVHYYKYGYKLAYPEMKEYSILLLNHIGVKSVEALARYLREGGFAAMGNGYLRQAERELRAQVGERVEEVAIELGHPLFHAFFDIRAYSEVNRGCGCPAVKSLAGLELDGRLVAVAGLPPFNSQCTCPSNQLYVNVLAYALIQPSSMGGRYLAREGK